MRVIIYVDAPCHFDIEIGDFPTRPVIGDIITLKSFKEQYRKIGLSKEEIEKLDSFDYLEVYNTTWENDNRGIHLRILCTTEK